MPKAIKRELLTDLLLQRLRDGLETGGDDHVAVGDHEAPDEGGWPDEEGRGTFVNYVVLTSLASASYEPGLQQDTIWLPYATTAIGISRKGVENAADRSRAALLGIVREDTSDDLRVNYVRETSFGAAERMGTTEPPYYAITDTVSVHVSQ